MAPSDNHDEKIERIITAFRAEDPPFEADRLTDVYVYNGRVGVRASNMSACHQEGKIKHAYYVEGTPYEMGFLMGLMAEPEISRMCTEFNKRVLFEFVDVHFRSRKLQEFLGELLEILLYLLSANIYPDIPEEYRLEMEGVLEGCREANPETKVDWQELWVCNVGVDALLSYVYTGNMPITRRLPVRPKPEHFAVPLMCNAFSVSGPAAEGNGHFLGRDFMFPTAGIFQDTACFVIQNAIDPEGNAKQPFVSQTAPGMIGSIAAMNLAGLGAGVDMSPAGNCNPSRPGFNSLLLVRHAVENAATCEQAVQLIVDAQRGVSWNYVLADFETQRACIVEAGASMGETDFARFAAAQLEGRPDEPSYRQLPEGLYDSLPDESFLNEHAGPEFRKGLMVRWSDYQYPEEFLAYNEELFRKFDKPYDPAYFDERGYINKTWKGKNCPKGYYFAPQRERDSHAVVVTNMFIIPEMRMYAMHPWTNLMAASQVDDLQWRYDELNNQLLSKLYPDPDGSLTPLSLEDAKELIDYLTPNPDKGKHPEYYNPAPEPPAWRRVLKRILGGDGSCPARADWRTIEIAGSVSLMDLKEKTIHSKFGYHGDEWVCIRLGEYV